MWEAVKAWFVGHTPRTGAKLQPGANKQDYIPVLFDSEWPLEKYELILLFSVCHITGLHYNVSVPISPQFDKNTALQGAGKYILISNWNAFHLC